MKYRKIPREKLGEGIELCKKNALDYLQDAKLIIEEKRFNHAYVSVQFAIEELGKIIMLREALKESVEDPILVKESVFKSHKGKSEKAWSFLDPKYKTIFDEGDFDDEDFHPRDFHTNTKASHSTRLDCAFVDFESGWYVGRDIKEELLTKLVKYVETMVPKA